MVALLAFATHASARLGAQEPTQEPAQEPARAARALPRGTVIAAGDVMVLGDSLPRELPIGWITRRVVQVGEPLRPPTIGRTPVVHTGRSVSLVAGTRVLQVVRTALALEDGAPGDTIKVRVDRGAIVTAIVRDSVTVVPAPSSRP